MGGCLETWIDPKLPSRENYITSCPVGSLTKPKEPNNYQYYPHSTRHNAYLNKFSRCTCILAQFLQTLCKVIKYNT